MRNRVIRAIGACLAVVVTLAGAAGAEAQYFGRNKVQYREFRFEVLKTEHFDIYFYAEERQAAENVGRLAERWYARLSVALNHSLRGRQPIVLYASHIDFQQTNVVSGEIGEGTGGVTEGLKRRVVLPLSGTLAETDHVLGHELVHAFQYDMARGSEDQPGGSSLDRLPLWFVEGMAEYLSIGPVDPQTAMWVRDALRHDTLPDIRKLGDPRYFPYRWGQALWAYIGGRWGERVVPVLFNAALSAGPDAAFAQVLTQSSRDLSASWHGAIREQYGGILESTRRPGSYGRGLIGEQRRERPLYASPVLSPDGRRIVFFSERSLLAVDLYVADADSGRIIRKLVDTAVDNHFGSLQFISSAGSWRPDGRQFVVGAVGKGRPVLAFLDIDSGRRTREVAFPTLSEILNPAWSPDGRVIAFSASSGGRSDLYLYDLAEDRLRSLTNDGFSDLQPAWSPDGRRIAFVTDRFTTEASTLNAGAYRLALVNPATGAIDEVETFAEATKSINPQWAADNRTLFFVSDPFGIPNLFSIDLASRAIVQITNLDTGISGITPLSPALSVAAGVRRLAFSAHDAGRPTVIVGDDAALLTGGPAAPTWTNASAASLPPERRASSELVAALADAQTGLPAATGEVSDYRAKLTLDWIGQPYMTAGYSRFGPTVGGGISFLWSDMLGNHNLATIIDANTYSGRFNGIWKDTGAVVAYQDLTHRWDWGLSLEQSPYIAGGMATGVGVVDGQPVYVDQEVLERQTFRAAGGFVARPFSPVWRVEIGGSYQRLGFEREIRTVVSSVATGQVFSDQWQTFELAEPLSLVSSSAALVRDSALFGATSPVTGERSRFEVTPTVGTIDFTGALVDYRRYVMPVPFYTLAARVLHYGRYGSGSEDARLVPLYIGYPQLVRGYDVGSISGDECSVTLDGSCPELDRLVGSRMLIGNLELRFPLLRPFGLSGRMYGPIPVEVALFADAGTAWSRVERPTFMGGDRDLVSSAGVSFRVNMLGFAVAQIDVAHPFQRPGRRWVWSFSLTPGF